MTKLARLAGALLLFTAAVFAGDDCLTGTDCCNRCPLAKQANARLATGHEALTVSKTVRGDYVKAVLANLEAI